MDFIEHLRRQMAWSRSTFGPGEREGVLDHIEKELVEVREAHGPRERAKEWVDIVILGLDGMWRSLWAAHEVDRASAKARGAIVPDPEYYWDMAAEDIATLIAAKQSRNELRNWPDWRTADPNKAIEHDRSGETAPKDDIITEGAISAHEINQRDGDCRFLYFKTSGKWGYEGRGWFPKYHGGYHEIDREEIMKNNNGKMPGIVSDGSCYLVIIIPDDDCTHPHAYPRMLKPINIEVKR